MGFGGMEPLGKLDAINLQKTLELGWLASLVGRQASRSAMVFVSQNDAA